MRSLTVLFIALALVAAPVTAGTFQFKKAGVEITSPEGWKSEEADGTVTIGAADGSIAVVFILLPAKDFSEAVKLLDKEAEKGVGGDIAWEEKPENLDLNGMKTEWWEGTAKEGAVVVEAAYIDTPSEEHVLAAYWFAAKDAYAKHDKAVEEMVKGIKPTAEKKEDKKEE
jgi:hypothetical protein